MFEEEKSVYETVIKTMARRIKELELDNSCLRWENDELKRKLEAATGATNGGSNTDQ